MSENKPRIPFANAWPDGYGMVAAVILLWAFLIGMVVLIYWTRVEDPSIGVASVIAGSCAAMGLLSSTVGRSLTMRKVRRFNAEMTQALATLARGELERAKTVFWQWSEGELPRAAAIARHNLGWALVRMGELEHAVAVATDNHEHHLHSLRAVGIATTSANCLALYHALLGNTADAETWLAKGDDLAKQLTLPPSVAGKMYARAVIECRAGRCANAARLLDENWAECEGLISGADMRPLRVVRAFAQADGGPRNAGVAEISLATARPAYPGEYDFLGVAWPEMAAFLATHGLSSPKPDAQLRPEA